MEITFVAKSGDVTGKGLIIVDGRYFGLPLEAAKLFERLHNEDKEKQNETHS